MNLSLLSYDELEKLASTSDDNNILEQLSKSTNDDIRYFLADNPNLSIELLETLSKDSNNLVRLNISRNKNVPTYILKQLSNDEDDYVRKVVLNNIIN